MHIKAQVYRVATKLNTLRPSKELSRAVARYRTGSDNVQALFHAVSYLVVSLLVRSLPNCTLYAIPKTRNSHGVVYLTN